jgi:hypothetical protein
MARLTFAQAYGYARQAGFDPASAVIAVSVGMAESGLVTDSRGDVGKQGAYWGPSVGLMQIRTVKSQTGTGKDRDISRLDDPLQNMIAAYDISKKGKDFSPWTTYEDGKFRQFLGQASTAAGAPSSSGPTQATNASFLGNMTIGALTGKAHVIVLSLLGIAAGGALVLLGGYQAVGSPKPPKSAALALL